MCSENEVNSDIKWHCKLQSNTGTAGEESLVQEGGWDGRGKRVKRTEWEKSQGHRTD